ncbi:hypothetical protein N9L20_03405 [Flavobacteriaceae bacterium]|nr:hypothetical protein [Flavobacteriaceae bacterium]
MMNIEELLREMDMQQAPRGLKSSIMEQIQTHKLLEEIEPINAPADLKSLIMSSLDEKQAYEPVISKKSWFIIGATLVLTLVWSFKNPVGSSSEKLWQKYLNNLDLGWLLNNEFSSLNQWLPLAGTISVAIILLLAFDQVLQKRWT